MANLPLFVGRGMIALARCRPFVLGQIRAEK
jgi:hypothetical protein